MTKTELQIALAEATQTNKKTAGVFLDTLGALAYKESPRDTEARKASRKIERLTEANKANGMSEEQIRKANEKAALKILKVLSATQHALTNILTQPGLVPVTCGCIVKATPTGDFAVFHCEDVHPLALEFLFRITRRAF
jgi:hypothetical protein